MFKGQVIIFPTDTVYGLGAKINDIQGINKIYKLKNRNPLKPLLVLIFSLQQIKHLVIIDKTTQKMINFFWPGPLTFIVKTTNFYQKNFYNEKTLGIRQPKNAIALKILKKYGPLKTTSVNKSNNPPIQDFDVIQKNYKNKVDYIFQDNQKNFSNISSTIIDTTQNFKILREGKIKSQSINDFFQKNNLS